MKKLFNNLAGNIAAISMRLEDFTSKINSSPTKYIKKIIARTEQNLNKISNSINNSNLTQQQQLKLQELLNKELEKLRTLQATIEEQLAPQKTINLTQECERLRKLLEKINKNIPEQTSTTINALTLPQKTELLTQLKSFKSHVKSFYVEQPEPSESTENLQLSITKPSL